MPVYEFKAVDGPAILEKYFPASKAPELGATIQDGGKFYKRIISGAPQTLVKNFAHVSRSLPRNCKGAPHYDAQGRPAFQTQREVTEFAKANDMHWD